MILLRDGIRIHGFIGLIWGIKFCCDSVSCTCEFLYFYVQCYNSIYSDNIFLNHSTLREFLNLVSVMCSLPFLTEKTSAWVSIVLTHWSCEKISMWFKLAVYPCSETDGYSWIHYLTNTSEWSDTGLVILSGQDWNLWLNIARGHPATSPHSAVRVCVTHIGWVCI